MLISEKEKFDLLLNIIKLDVSIRVEKKSLKGLQGCCYGYQKIKLTLLPNMNQKNWSKAAAILLHEFGHSHYIHNERKAWQKAENWIDCNFPQLKPKEFYSVQNFGLNSYKMCNQLRKEYYKCFDYELAVEKCTKWMKKHMPGVECRIDKKIFLRDYQEGFDY